MTAEAEEKGPSFTELELGADLLKGVAELGWRHPSTVQQQAIPVLMQGRDLIGQARTGTGKTGAFGLPMLERVRVTHRAPQGLVVVPTRELAHQVTEALRGCARHLGKLRVLATYGGTPIVSQIQAIERGVHVIVGTPGRLVDLLEREALDLETVRMAVLDEADVMLDMGFRDDVQAILSKVPEHAQRALFSATIPDAVRKIADRHLREPVVLAIASDEPAAADIEQGYVRVPTRRKVEMLCRFLEVEGEGSTVVFARTRERSEEVARELVARGFTAEFLNGDLAQTARERLMRRFRAGDVAVLVATDVAARGLDVEHVELVINLDAPHDAETWVHRIGRTGRAGRSGRALLFATTRDRAILEAIERFIGRPVPQVFPPEPGDVLRRRIEDLKAQVLETLAAGDLEIHRGIVREMVEEGVCSADDVAAAALALARRDRPLVVQKQPRETARRRTEDRPERPEREPRARTEDGFVRLFVNLGAVAGIRPGDLVGAITNEAPVTGRELGAIDIKPRYSTIEVQRRVVEPALEALNRTRLRGRPVRASVDRDAELGEGASPPRREPRHVPGGPRAPRQAPRRGPPRGGR